MRGSCFGPQLLASILSPSAAAFLVASGWIRGAGDIAGLGHVHGSDANSKLESATAFVRGLGLPPAPAMLEATAAEGPETLLATARDQAAVVGADVISFVNGVTVEQRQDLINSALLAQLVAKTQVPDSTNIYGWYAAYFDVLKQLGWVVQSEQFSTYQTSSVGFEAHEAILGVATTLLGAAPTALAVVKATLESLKSLSANSPWLTIFNRETQTGRTAHFQVSLAERDDKGQFLVTLMAFGLEAKSTLTQILFFKIHTSEDTLKNYAGKVTIDSDVLSAIRDDIKQKITQHARAYVKTLPDLRIPPPPPPPPPAALENLSPLSSALLGDVSDAVFADASGFREEPVEAPARRADLEATVPPANPSTAISAAGYQFIVRWETGGRSYYENAIKGRPVWPGYASGLTIGCGWDLGYHNLPQFQAQWSGRLPASDFERLAASPPLGLRAVEPDRAGKVARLKALVESFGDIEIPWTVALAQFDTVKFPQLVLQLYAALDNFDRLHPHCRAALLSLTFNRGPAFAAAGPRFAEMRAIGEAMRSGQGQDFARIPDLIRGMKRLWGANSSLSARREGEAALFEAGLRETKLLADTPRAATASLESAGASERLADVAGAPTDDADPAEIERMFAASQLEAAGASVASVKWNDKDDEQPDYRHLDNSLSGRTFDLHPEDLEALIAANGFAPLPGKLVFALRGASLGEADKRENMPVIAIADQRPDHRRPRCVIGVYDRAARSLSAYQASTVPNAAYVLRCCQEAQAGKPVAQLTGNILPTGCYTYTVGTHHPGTRREIPGVLRLAQSASGASPVVVLRSLDDTIYDRFDWFVIATPADNVHPAQMRDGFSSAGCLTIPGFYAEGAHSGVWADFRAALGLGPGSDGRHFSLMLLTGLDAALAAKVRTTGADVSQIARLRHGSTGPRVGALQRALGLGVEANPQFGPVTRQALVARQVARLGWSDAIYAPAMDGLLGLQIF